MENLESAAPKTFVLGDFEGPLDLLLFLITKNELNIYDIPVARITEQFVAYIQHAVDRDLDAMSEFRVMAATLLYIKSRMLLPVEVKDADEMDPRRNLTERLIEYQQFKKLSHLMEHTALQAELCIERKKQQRILPFDEEPVALELNISALFNTFSSLLSKLSAEQLVDLSEEISVNEKIAFLLELLYQNGQCTFRELLIRPGSIMEIVCTFFAILESVKSRLVTIFQHEIFADILIRPVAAEGQHG
ncbi:segregation and condensation protein A [Spirochaetia bacterium]|nr:segregation and condensation protein A [Spirochaetia bacterium]GHU31067.1 segregation and condensation protein A [Spirochaetia bacterium]